MRFSSLSSSPSDLSIESDLYSSEYSIPTDITDLPHSHNQKRREQLYPLSDTSYQISNCMFDSLNDWVQPEGYDDCDLDYLGTSSGQEQQRSPFPNESSVLYGQHWIPPNAVTGFSHRHQQQQQQQPPPSSFHRRFPSTSSVASGAESQFSNHPVVPSQPYPAPQPLLPTYQQNYQSAWTHDTSSPTSSVQHLPTPIGTPTYDKHFQTSGSRRSKPAAGHEAFTAAHQSVRSALNQQWIPREFESPQGQSHIYSFQDMPRTPQTSHGDDIEMQAQRAVSASVPKLDRTVSDARADELYNPAPFSTTAPRSQPHNTTFYPPQPSMLQDRLRDANEARSSSTPSQPSGHVSPWRSSPYGDGVQYDSQNTVMQTAANMRQQMKEKSDAYAMQQHQSKTEDEEPKTVSPKDAFPDQPMAKEEESLPSLFPTESSQSNGTTNVQYAPINMAPQEYNNTSSNVSVPQSGFSFTMPAAPASAQSYYQQQQPVQYGPVNGDYSYGSFPMPARLVSMETTKSDGSESPEAPSEGRVERPADATAGAGRYTCTYSDNQGQCMYRCDNGSELNKHKREVHRHTGPASNNAKRATSMTQSGPHKCTRINPSTGKPCNTIFSRPYDLTRHEDTIHGEGKKLRCPHCAEEKLFSRNDALTRHLKVVHSQQKPIIKGQRGRRSIV